MPKYYDFKVCGYFLYYTSHCIVEAMHVHVSDRQLRESGSAKFFVRSDGCTVVKNRGILSDKELSVVQKFIKTNYQEMYKKWSDKSTTGFYQYFDDEMER